MVPPPRKNQPIFCPDCRHREFEVTVLFSGVVACSFTDDNQTADLVDAVTLHSGMDDNSIARCKKCGWEGLLAQLRSGLRHPSDQTLLFDPYSPEEFAEIKRRLARGEFSGRWEHEIRRLVSEVSRLQQLLENLTPILKKDQSINDTWIG